MNLVIKDTFLCRGKNICLIVSVSIVLTILRLLLEAIVIIMFYVLVFLAACKSVNIRKLEY